MFAVELLANSAATLCFEHAQQFHISQITGGIISWVLYENWLKVKLVRKL